MHLIPYCLIDHRETLGSSGNFQNCFKMKGPALLFVLGSCR